VSGAKQSIRAKLKIQPMMKLQKKVARVSEQDRRAEIYNAAAKIISEKGFDAMTMNDIAQAVGMTKAGIYHYIEGKQNMLFAIMNYGMDKLDNGVIAPASQIDDAERRLVSIIHCHAKLITEGSNAITVLVDEVAGLSSLQRKKIIQRKRVYFDFIRNTLDSLKAEGKLKEVDTTVAAFSILGMLLWISRWYRADGKLTSAQVADEVLKVALGGMLKTPRRLLRKP
jgi:TetR/AcrR family transcriptional regulator, cholesterol catabolism regulator